MNTQPYSPQQPQNSLQDQSSSYLPPQEYVSLQAKAPIPQAEEQINPERQYIIEKVAELEKGIDSIFLKFYQIWLCLIGISSFGDIAYIVYLLASAKDISKVADIMAILLVLVLWIGVQSIYGQLAMVQKSISKANITCWMMIMGLIPGILMDVKIILALAKYPDPKDEWAPVLKVLITAVSVQVAAHIVMSMIGGFRVRKILLERELLQEKLNRLDYSFRA